MIYWLDSQLNTRTRPQENFGREIMELFSLGVGNYIEQDVYAAARVFTGFNWQLVGDRASTDRQSTTRSSTGPPITTPTPRSSLSRSIRTAAARFPRAPRRQASRTPSTSDRRAGAAPGDRDPAGDAALPVLRQRDRRLPSGARRSAMANVYLSTTPTSRRCCATLFRSSQFRDPANFFQRYSWPVEYVVARSRKSAGPAFRSTPR